MLVSTVEGHVNGRFLGNSGRLSEHNLDNEDDGEASGGGSGGWRSDSPLAQLAVNVIILATVPGAWACGQLPGHIRGPLMPFLAVGFVMALSLRVPRAYLLTYKCVTGAGGLVVTGLAGSPPLLAAAALVASGLLHAAAVPTFPLHPVTPATTAALMMLLGVFLGATAALGQIGMAIGVLAGAGAGLATFIYLVQLSWYMQAVRKLRSLVLRVPRLPAAHPELNAVFSGLDNAYQALCVAAVAVDDSLPRTAALSIARAPLAVWPDDVALQILALGIECSRSPPPLTQATKSALGRLRSAAALSSDAQLAMLAEKVLPTFKADHLLRMATRAVMSEPEDVLAAAESTFWLAIFDERPATEVVSAALEFAAARELSHVARPRTDLVRHTSPRPKSSPSLLSPQQQPSVMSLETTSAHMVSGQTPAERPRAALTVALAWWALAVFGLVLATALVFGHGLFARSARVAVEVSDATHMHEWAALHTTLHALSHAKRPAWLSEDGQELVASIADQVRAVAAALDRKHDAEWEALRMTEHISLGRLAAAVGKASSGNVSVMADALRVSGVGDLLASIQDARVLEADEPELGPVVGVGSVVALSAVLSLLALVISTVPDVIVVPALSQGAALMRKYMTQLRELAPSEVARRIRRSRAKCSASHAWDVPGKLPMALDAAALDDDEAALRTKALGVVVMLCCSAAVFGMLMVWTWSVHGMAARRCEAYASTLHTVSSTYAMALTAGATSRVRRGVYKAYELALEPATANLSSRWEMLAAVPYGIIAQHEQVTVLETLRPVAVYVAALEALGRASSVAPDEGTLSSLADAARTAVLEGLKAELAIEARVRWGALTLPAIALVLTGVAVWLQPLLAAHYWWLRRLEECNKALQALVPSSSGGAKRSSDISAELALNAFGDAALVCEYSSAVVMANAEAGRLFGASSPEELHGLLLSELVSDPSTPLDLVSSSSSLACRARRLDGTTFDCQLSCETGGAAGSQRESNGFLFVTARDVSSQRAASVRACEFLLRSTPYGLFMWDPMEEEGWYSEAVSDILGVPTSTDASPEALLQRALMPADWIVIQGALEDLARRMQGRGRRRRSTKGESWPVYVHPNLSARFGNKLTMDSVLSAHPELRERSMAQSPCFSALVRISAGRAVRYVELCVTYRNVVLAGSLHDVTASVTRALSMGSGEAEPSSGVVLSHHFLAEASHEIVMPLHAIISASTALAAADDGNEQQMRFAQSVASCARQLQSLLWDVTVYSRMGEGKLVFQSHAFEVRPRLAHTLAFAVEACAEKDVELAVVVDPRLPQTLKGDGSALAKVVENVVRAAVRRTSQGVVVVEAMAQDQLEAGSELAASLPATAQETDSDEIMLVVRVAETSPGLSTAESQALLGHMQSVGGGDTLALTICHQVVTMMGGKLGVAKEAETSSVWFTLPMEVVESSLTSSDLMTVSMSRQAELDGEGERKGQRGGAALELEPSLERVLLFHPIPAMVSALTTVFRALSLDSVVATSRVEFLFKASTVGRRGTVFVIDEGSTSLNMAWALSKVAATYPDVPMVLMCSESSVYRFEAMLGPLAATVTKPLTSFALLEALHAVSRAVGKGGATSLAETPGTNAVSESDLMNMLQAATTESLSNDGSDVPNGSRKQSRGSNRRKKKRRRRRRTSKGLDAMSGKSTTEAAAGDSSLARDMVENGNRSAGGASKGHVLLVEDDTVNQIMATVMIQEVGFTVDTAENGLQCVDKVRADSEGKIDIILMDCVMPEMDGYEATELIRKIESESHPRRVPVTIIACTALSPSEVRSRCFLAGMDDFVSKPIQHTALADKLHLHMQKRKNRLQPAVINDASSSSTSAVVS
ncbi:sensor protein [Thecamonas trahens ATCC 50062]|uniref:Sensor protein n=1 Tax=Thecamonas trahens ATCC 50062 TaxID=461836 RepID=A0A0L0DQU7_THETB|nr:sensor protein [Thecamonas trahens ATCC 50062]KNC53808.1 sensor protein [Thecamonas trahens ATCC 50062]|eukprot:XP_013754366.1 sensor protein [Thecamonas trahens ATCC 50062]